VDGMSILNGKGNGVSLCSIGNCLPSALENVKKLVIYFYPLNID
jgi:hypothetical protein